MNFTGNPDDVEQGSVETHSPKGKTTYSAEWGNDEAEEKGSNSKGKTTYSAEWGNDDADEKGSNASGEWITDENNEKSKFKESLVDWVSSTNIHGLPHLVNRTSPVKRVFWCLLTVAALSFLISQLMEMVVKYYEYPTKTEVERIHLKEVNFPAITLCDMNIISRHQLIHSKHKGLMAKFDSILGKDLAANPNPRPITMPPLSDMTTIEPEPPADSSTTVPIEIGSEIVTPPPTVPPIVTPDTEKKKPNTTAGGTVTDQAKTTIPLKNATVPAPGKVTKPPQVNTTKPSVTAPKNNTIATKPSSLSASAKPESKSTINVPSKMPTKPPQVNTTKPLITAPKNITIATKPPSSPSSPAPESKSTNHVASKMPSKMPTKPTEGKSTNEMDWNSIVGTKNPKSVTYQTEFYTFTIPPATGAPDFAEIMKDMRNKQRMQKTKRNLPTDAKNLKVKRLTKESKTEDSTKDDKIDNEKPSAQMPVVVPANRTQLQKEFKRIYSDLTKEEREDLGKQKEAFVHQVSFNGDTITTDEFEHFVSPKYGNCYTFNSGKRFIHTVEGTGPGVGLDIILAVNETDYLPTLTETVGIRLVIHDQKMMPFPEAEGYSLSPGYDIKIGLNMAIREHASFPYGRCRNLTDDENQKINAYSDILPHVQYSFRSCYSTCLQIQIIRTCKCIYPFYTTDSDIININDPDSNNGTKLPICDVTQGDDSSEIVKCVNRVRQIVGHSHCQITCPQDCLEFQYKPTFSFGRWPAFPFYEATLMPQIAQRLYKLGVTEATVRQMTEDYVKNNYLRIGIYFENLELVYIKTGPGYEINDLLSDLGGQLGLWLGISILTVLEVVELVYDLTIQTSVEMFFKKKATRTYRKFS